MKPPLMAPGHVLVFSFLLFLFLPLLFLPAAQRPLIAAAEEPHTTHYTEESQIEERYINDEAGVLAASQVRQLEELLRSHHRLTGHYLLVRISRQPPSVLRQDAQEGGTWRNMHKSGVLRIFWNEREADLELGLGLSALVAAGSLKEVLTKTIIPQIGEAQFASALELGLKRILSLFGSPLAERSLPEDSIHQGREVLRAFFLAVVALGVPLLILILTLLFQREVHYTSAGIFQVNPVRLALWEWGRKKKNE